ncbi:MAG: crossover junction endodeoxyribonuclease RuvC [Myxococcota bacterium]
MIILGIDPGTVHTGYGVVESAGSRMAHVENGLLVPPRGAELSDKVRCIFDGVIRLIDTYRPEALAIEEIFVGKNSRSALVLGHARGVILLAGNMRGVPATGYTPAVVKRCVTGNGAATKEQVQEMVRMLLKLPAVAQEDASDALALAICHAVRAGAPCTGLRR